MRGRAALLAACLLLNTGVSAKPLANQQVPLQIPLEDEDQNIAHHHLQTSSRQLQGRFLHITDIHPDSHYKIHASTEEEHACHRGKGTSGIYGAETTDCDSPFALVNATFKWIEENLKDQVDFVIWTGDSARHDNDEKIPRDQDEVLNTNTWVAEKFVEVFSESSDPRKSLSIPIIPTFGNNDILPHNILLSGPNKWLKTYANIWSKFIPEEQRHGFERGGWFYVEVIPNHLAVFSLNTLYFFNNNAAVDGCALPSEPGYEHMEWLRIQLQFLRERGMKAILTGHVPPARTESKQLWDETCWQKYTLWLQQFRDVVVGAFYGHMNIDHFVLHDSKDVKLLTVAGEGAENANTRTTLDEELSVQSAGDYLQELRKSWSNLPYPSSANKGLETEAEEEDDNKGKSRYGKEEEEKKEKKEKKGKKGKKDKKDPFKKIGGQWGERFMVTHIGPSVVPNFFPTLRIVEYNITALDPKLTWARRSVEVKEASSQKGDASSAISFEDYIHQHPEDEFDSESAKSRGKKKKHGKPKKPKNPDLIIPSPPPKTSPPGPAYSPQTLTLLGYTQYFANLTYINNEEFVKEGNDEVNDARWHEGKHHGKHPRSKDPHPKPFEFQLEYSTFNDTVYKLKDLTVRSYMKLAHRIGQYKALKKDELEIITSLDPEDEEDEEDIDTQGDHKNKDKKKKKKKKKKNKNKKEKKKRRKQIKRNRFWLSFIQRAFVGTLEDDELTGLS